MDDQIRPLDLPFRIEGDRFLGARLMVDRLAAVRPQTWETAELAARVLHAQSQKDKARDVLLTYADRPKARVDFAAAVMDELGQTAEAEKLFKQRGAAQMRGQVWQFSVTKD